MADRSSLDRRSFLRNAGFTALAGAALPGAAHAAGLAPPDDFAEPPDGKYDFDNAVNRVGTDSTKYDRQIALFGQIDVGMGIADTDFKPAPCITRALLARIQQDNLGYLTIPPSYAESIVQWNKRRYNLTIDPKTIVHSPALHPAIIATLRAFSPPGSKVLVPSPAYSGFYSDIRVAGLRPEDCPFRLVNGRYQFDFEDLERHISHDTHTLILCNPQNPTGNVWSREDLKTLGEICLRRRVVVLADEIHCDLITKGHQYTPFASLDNEEIVRNSLTFKAASKSFNLPALKVGYMFSTNPDYLARVRVWHRDELNTMGVVAQQAAYTEGDRWLDQLIAYNDANLTFVEDYIRRNIPLIKFVKSQGTYLAWIDVNAVIDKIGAKARAEEANRQKAPTAPTVTPEAIVERYFAEHARVQMNPGSSYGTGGAGRMRMNTATSRKRLELALGNIATALQRA
jgi:cystathionine beta-lyase